MGIGAQLLEERERLGLSQAEFAGLAGLTERAQRMYEKDERQPDSKYLVALAAHGVDVLYVLTGERASSEGGLSAEEAALVDNYRHATEKGRAAARAVLDAFEKPTPSRGRRRAAGDGSD